MAEGRSHPVKNLLYRLVMGIGAGTRRALRLDADRNAIAADMLRFDRRLSEERETLARIGGALGELAARLDRIEENSRENAAALEKRLSASEESANSRLQALSEAAEEARGHTRFLTRAAHNAPAYVQEGLNAILMLEGWDGLPFVVPTTHIGVFQTFRRLGAHSAEAAIRNLIREHLAAEDVAVDIGAHVGLHAVVMGHIVKDGGGVHAFEPDPELAAALQQTFTMNGLNRTGAVTNAAVADKSGEMNFFRTLHSPESSLFAPIRNAVRDQIRTRVVTLDEYFEPGARVDFMKIDAEGAEPAIFRGMKRVMAENPRLRIILEFAAHHIARSGDDPSAFLDTISNAGFSISAIDEKSGETGPVSRDRLLAEEGFNLRLEPAARQGR